MNLATMLYCLSPLSLSYVSKQFRHVQINERREPRRSPHDVEMPWKTKPTKTVNGWILICPESYNTAKTETIQRDNMNPYKEKRANERGSTEKTK